MNPFATETTASQESDVIRVAIIDDHPIARRGVEQILTEAGGMEVVATAQSPADLAEQLSARGPEAGDATVDVTAVDVMILDLYHDGDTPCLEAVARLSVSTRVLVMSASGRPADVLGAIRSGAVGYVTKQSTQAMFVSAVETVAGGGFWLSSRLADILQAELVRPTEAADVAQSAPATRTSVLSRREEEALGLIAGGFTHAQTATRMGVSKATVDTYVERIRAKLQVGNKAELTRAALQHLAGQADE